MDIKLTINSQDRIVVVPIQYDENTDTLNISEIQIEPEPKKDENIQNDIVLKLAMTILNVFKSVSD